MKYEDDKLLSLEQYSVMAKAYSQEMKKQGFMFIAVDAREDEALISETYESLCKIKSSLFYLGGFLGTAKLYSLTERQIKTYQVLYPSCEQIISYRIRGDKTKCFLNMLSLESKLLSELLNLSKTSPFSDQLNSFIKERLYLCGEIYKITGLIN